MESKKISKKEIELQLKIAMKEIGKILPKYNKTYKCWNFEHPLYPVTYSGTTAEEVIENYPLYLKEFIEERLNNNLNALIEKQTKGKGGKREGAGRPIEPNKEPKVRVYLPLDIANLLKEPGVVTYLRGLIQASHHVQL